MLCTIHVMRKLVYDLPTRLFHISFILLFVAAYTIGNVFDSKSDAFPYHMLCGMTLLVAVLLRITWGFIGTKHALFTDFDLKPANLISYLRGVWTGRNKIWAGHNPASSWSSLAMISLALALGLTGLLAVKGVGGETLGKVHEFLGTALLIVAIAHILGVLVHTIKMKDDIGWSMVDGKKSGVSEGEAISNPRNLVGVIGFCIVIAWGIALYNQYDPSEKSLNMFGVRLQLGESQSRDNIPPGYHFDNDDDRD